jgi:formylglycine-generating enzyme required for sulfatase activity
MVLIPGGTFLMGTADVEGYPEDHEGPVREVELDPFWIDSCSVTNAEFTSFVEATGYRTMAEACGWSFVFHALLAPEAESAAFGVVAAAPWWRAVRGAEWRHPEGPGSDLAERADHPVVHVSWNDAVAYCTWASATLPSEAQWERAARGGLSQKRYPWGDELRPDGRWRCNIWQGAFPERNTAEDGYLSTAPVRTYEPNGFGLYQMAGNVWEWCADRWSAETMVMRGGSYLCHESYCNRYRVAARSSNTPDSTTGNLGFRCARTMSAPKRHEATR